jgi:hypothetical protein
MKSMTIKPPMRCTVIVKGDVHAIRDAVAERIDPSRPIRDVNYNEVLDLTWATVWADAGQLNAWMGAKRGVPGAMASGDLTMWFGHDGQEGISQ